jgi:hypothetical protein
MTSSKESCSIINNPHGRAAIKLLETMILKLTTDELPVQNYCIANRLGWYSCGQESNHKPYFFSWDLLKMSPNIKVAHGKYSIPKSKIDLVKSNKISGFCLIDLSYEQLYLLAQIILGKLVRQVYDCFESTEFLTNAEVCRRCKLHTISPHGDYVSWSLLYFLYRQGYLTRHLKSKSNQKQSYKWRLNSDKPFSKSDFNQPQIMTLKKISLGHQSAILALKEFSHTYDILETFIEYQDPECVDKKCLPFDIMIILLADDIVHHVYFEIDGEQHFKTTLFSKDKKLKYIQSHDRIKTSFVIDNDDIIVRIPYVDNHRIKQIIKYALDNAARMSGCYTTSPKIYDYLEIDTIKRIKL